MGVQTKILRRTFTGDVQRYEVTKDDQGKPTGTELKTVQYSVGTGTLIGGTPGQIYDVAYGPVVHTTTLPATADIGSFVEGQGIIINAPEYALYGTLRENGEGGALAPSLALPAGTVVSCMTAGHVWIQRKYLETIQAKMNTMIIWQQTPENEGDSSDDSDNDLLVVEVNGLLPVNPDSSANG